MLIFSFFYFIEEFIEYLLDENNKDASIELNEVSWGSAAALQPCKT